MGKTENKNTQKKPNVVPVNPASKSLSKEERREKKKNRDPETKQKYHQSSKAHKKQGEVDSLKQGKFRYLNELLYTQHSKGAVELFESHE